MDLWQRLGVIATTPNIKEVQDVRGIHSGHLQGKTWPEATIKTKSEPTYSLPLLMARNWPADEQWQNQCRKPRRTCRCRYSADSTYHWPHNLHMLKPMTACTVADTDVTAALKRKMSKYFQCLPAFVASSIWMFPMFPIQAWTGLNPCLTPKISCTTCDKRTRRSLWHSTSMASGLSSWIVHPSITQHHPKCGGHVLRIFGSGNHQCPDAETGQTQWLQWRTRNFDVFRKKRLVTRNIL